MQLTEAMFGAYPMPEAEAPEGLLLHTAGESDQGWYMYDVWESKEAFPAVRRQQARPGNGSVRGGSRTPPQFFPVETLVKGPAL